MQLFYNAMVRSKSCEVWTGGGLQLFPSDCADDLFTVIPYLVDNSQRP